MVNFLVHPVKMSSPRQFFSVRLSALILFALLCLSHSLAMCVPGEGGTGTGWRP